MIKNNFFVALLIFFIVSCQTSSRNNNRIYYSEDNKTSLEEEYKQKALDEPNNDDNLYNYSYILYKNKKYDEALHYIEKLLIENPFSVTYYLLHGQIQYDIQDFNAARQSFTFATLYDPNNLYGHYGLALVYYNTGELDLAKTAIDAALLIDPYFFDGKLLDIRIKSDINKNTNNHLELLQQLELLEIQKKNSVDIVKLKVKLYADMKQTINAEKAITNYNANNPIKDDLKGLLCDIKIQLGKLVEANEVISSMSDNVNKWQCSINLLVVNEQYIDAIELYNKRKNDFYLNINNQLILPHIYLKQGYYKLALNELENLYYDNYHNNPLLNYYIADTYLHLTDFTLAEKYIIQSINVNPNFIKAKLLYIEILLKLNKFDLANRIFNENSFAPLDPEILKVRADIHYSQSKFSEAKLFYNAAQEIFFSPIVEVSIAEIEFNEKNYQGAIDRLSNLMIISKNPIIMIKIATFHYLLGNYSACIEYLNLFSNPEQNLEAGLFYGLCKIYNDEINSGLNILINTANKFNENTILIDELTYQLARFKRVSEAIPFLEVLITLKPNEANYLNQRLADFYKQINFADKEIEARRKYFSN